MLPLGQHQKRCSQGRLLQPLSGRTRTTRPNAESPQTVILTGTLPRLLRRAVRNVVGHAGRRPGDSLRSVELVCSLRAGRIESVYTIGRCWCLAIDNIRTACDVFCGRTRNHCVPSDCAARRRAWRRAVSAAVSQRKWNAARGVEGSRAHARSLRRQTINPGTPRALRSGGSHLRRGPVRSPPRRCPWPPDRAGRPSSRCLRRP